MPLLETKGAASAQGFGFTLGGAEPVYIEQIFSTFLYTGNGSTQTITNGIDLAGKGGMVWIKSRSTASDNILTDTLRGAGTSATDNNALSSNLTGGQDLGGVAYDYLSSFNANGFNVTYSGTGTTSRRATNFNGTIYASWTFREQPKFFDVVTYTGNGVQGRSISHNLGSVPGCMIIKKTSGAEDWIVYHRSLSNNLPTNIQIMNLNLANAAATVDNSIISSTPTATQFFLGSSSAVNQDTATYVIYLFAHNAGGFGLSGTDNVISCGSFTADGSGNATVDLGYEPQWILWKQTTGTAGWNLTDTMRGMSYSATAFLTPNSSGAESVSAGNFLKPTATGFQGDNGTFANSTPYIYIAIRRGPMRVPTTGTSVLGLNARTGTGANATVTGGAGVTDLAIIKRRNSTPVWAWASRLTGTGYLSSNATTAETAAGTTMLQANPWDVMDGVKVGTTSDLTNASSGTFINYLIDRAPGFFDEVCYTGTGSNITLNHNLGAVPELMIFKTRTGAVRAWGVYSSTFGVNKKLILNTTAAVANDSFFVDTTPTATVFYPGNADESNEGGNTYVAYLFASCPGVSKVGSYTGTGTTQVINCGFAAGARFVLIKRTDSTGDWYVWDSARGIVAGNDPYLLLNSTAAEVTNTDFIDTASTGFEISSTAPAAINASGGTFIFLAIA